MDLTKINTKFGELPRTAQLALFEAMLMGKIIEGYIGDSGFIRMKNPSWFPHIIYRVQPEPVVPDQLRWEFIDEGYKWCARDGNGSVWVYKEKPFYRYSSWGPVKSGTSVCEGLGAAKNLHTPGNLPWNESLIERPKNV